MNSDVIADLKQFIEATISQQLANVATKGDIQQLQGNVQQLQGDVQQIQQQLNDQDMVLQEIQNAVGRTFNDHETRITRLEKQLA